MIAFGTGGIKPCVSAFGGDQFDPSQKSQLKQFFAFFYLSINLGSLISTVLTPILRSGFTCGGRNDCFPLAFGIPAALMTVALIVFLCGKRLYKKEQKPEENVLAQFFMGNLVSLMKTMHLLYY